MPVDFAAKFQEFYPPGAARIYVSPSGNDSNPGTQGSPKRQINAALAAMPSSGGIIWVANGAYNKVSISDRRFSPSAWCLIMAQNYLGPTIFVSSDPWPNAGFVIRNNSAYIGIFGFDITGQGPGGSGIWGAGKVHHIATWRNRIKNCLVGIGYPGNQGWAGPSAAINNLDICYNIVTDCAKDSGDPYGSSGISIYNLWNTSIFPESSGDDAYGYSNYVVGNIVAWNHQNNEGVDGNGIIIDDGNNTQSYGGPTGSVYTGRTLVMGNLCIKNGGRGIQAFQQPNIDVCFNTAAYNSWRKSAPEFYGEFGFNTTPNSRCMYNVGWPDTSNPYWVTYYDEPLRRTNNLTTVVGNVRLRGNEYTVETTIPSIDRTSDGLNYFKNNNPVVPPENTTFTFTNADDWRPDGGAGSVVTGVLSETDYNKWSRWPDLFGENRPARLTGWAAGFTESGVPGGGVAPVASFNASLSSVQVNTSVSFTDTSSNAPTSWSWSFGDSSTSTSQNPTKSWATPGTYTVSLTASNSSGSSSASRTITVTSQALAPVASFTFSPASPEVGQVVTFTDTSTNTPTSWVWDFGD